MPFIAEVGSPDNNRCLHLDTLVRLRWTSITAQLVILFIVRFVLHFPLPLVSCLVLVVAAIGLNVFLKLNYPTPIRILDPVAASLLAFDIVQLSALFYFTGGVLNPFMFLLVAPVVVSGTALGRKLTLSLASLAGVLALGLLAFHQPLPWPDGQSFDLPINYRIAIVLAFGAALAFMANYSSHVAEEARKLATALAATELALTREQSLQRLDGLAAAAAHELGTPLATIALVAKELEREVPPDSLLAEDIRLLRSQSLRCREILGKLSSLGNEFDGSLAKIQFTHLIEDVISPHRGFDREIKVHTEGDAATEPVGSRNTSILYGLGNLVENAVDFSAREVEIIARWSEDTVMVIIADDGPGFANDMIDRMGEPYLTKRRAKSTGKSDAGGLGLGFFISKTLLERTGAKMRVSNRVAPQSGAVITIEWARDAFLAA